ncbi:MAG: mechanosensitive ion channel [Deltaproteobacteria bacterium]|nr:mechanosensitive ion channel [Deltaproteobacteria bacterium]
MTPEQIQGYVDTGVKMAVEYAPRVVAVVFIIIIGRWLAGKIAKLAGAAMRKAKLDEMLASFGENVVRSFGLLITVLFCLEMFGIKTTSFVAVLAAAGFAVGMALQGSLGNFAAGVLLLIFRPFKIGDVINAGGATGGVTAVGIFATTLQTPDFQVITVANGSITGGNIVNYTNFPKRRVDVNVGAAYDAEPLKVKEVLNKMMGGIPEVLNDEGIVTVLTGLGASSVDYQMRAYCEHDDYWTVLEKMNQGAWYALNEADIGIPYNTLDVHIVSEPKKG